MLKIDIKSKLHLYITFGLCVILLFFAYSCEPKTKSLLDSTKSVTLSEYKSEIEILTDRFLTGFRDIEKKTAFRDFILQQSLTYTTTGSLDPIGIISSIMVLLGIGAAVDDVKVRKKLNAVNKNKPTN